MKMKKYITALCLLFVPFVYAGNNQGAVAMPDSFSADAAAKILQQGGMQLMLQ